MTRIVIAITTLLLLAGCASMMPDTTTPNIPSIGLSLEDARRITGALEARMTEKNAGDPLITPKSLEDVQEILRRDQIDLFPGGIAFAEKQEGVTALALRAQIELAWGEAQIILAEIFQGTTTNLRQMLTNLEARNATGGLQDAEKDVLNELRKSISEATTTAEALAKLASEHVAAGANLAREVISKNPADYHGYRVAADFYRLRQDWAGFDGMVKKIEETNPQSNGLVFLQGISAAQREGDAAKAIGLFKKAIERDNKFVRAQAQIMLLQGQIPNIYAEFGKLKAMNPNHQIVLWAGDYIQKAYDQWKDQKDRKPGAKH